jgi:hypothetical protein
LGRSHAGDNCRSDYELSLILGEEVAISLLRDQKVTFNEIASWNFTRFDGPDDNPRGALFALQKKLRYSVISRLANRQIDGNLLSLVNVPLSSFRTAA